MKLITINILQLQNGSNRILCDECCYRIIFLYEFWTVALLSKKIILSNQPLQFRKADVHLKRKNASNLIFRSYVQRLFVLKQKTDAHRQYFMRQLENYAGEDHASLTPDLSQLRPFQYTNQAPYTVPTNPAATSSSAVPQSFNQNVVDPYQRITNNISYAQNNTFSNNNTTNNNNNNNTNNNTNSRESYTFPNSNYQLSSVNPTAYTNVASNNILPGPSYNNSWPTHPTQNQSTSSDNLKNIFKPPSDNNQRQKNLNSINSYNYQNWPTTAFSSTSKSANIAKPPSLRRDSISQAGQNERFQLLKDSAAYNMQNFGYGMSPQPQVQRSDSQQTKSQNGPMINMGSKQNILSSQNNFPNLPLNSPQTRLPEPALYSDQRANPQYQSNRAAEQMRNHELTRNHSQSVSVQQQYSQVPHNSQQPNVPPGQSAPKGVPNGPWPYNNNTFYCDNGLQISTVGSKVTCNNSVEQLNYLNTCFSSMGDTNSIPFNPLNASNTAVNNRVENTTNSLNPQTTYNEQTARATNAFNNYPRPVVPTPTVTENWRTPAVPKQNKQNVNPFSSYNSNAGNPNGVGLQNIQKPSINYQPPPPYWYNSIPSVIDFPLRSAKANSNQNNYVSAAAPSNGIAQGPARAMISKESPNVIASSPTIPAVSPQTSAVNNCPILLDRIIADLDGVIPKNANPQTFTRSQIPNPAQNNPSTAIENANENNASTANSIESNLIPNNTATDTSNNNEPAAQNSTETVSTNTAFDSQISDVSGMIENAVAEKENVTLSLDEKRYTVETESITPELNLFPDMPSLEDDDFVSTEISVKLDPKDIIPPEGDTEPSEDDTESAEENTEPIAEDTESAEENTEPVVEDTESAEGDSQPAQDNTEPAEEDTILPGKDAVESPRVISISPSLMENENNEDDLNNIEVKPTLKVVNMEEMMDHISEFRLKHFSKRLVAL